jgi:hypothetical protein
MGDESKPLFYFYKSSKNECCLLMNVVLASPFPIRLYQELALAKHIGTMAGIGGKDGRVGNF